LRNDCLPEPAAELSGRIVILANPAAGGADRGALARFVAALAGPTRQIETIISAGPGDLRRLSQEVVADVLIVAGGDGSINEAVEGLLARHGPRPVLGIIPQGTVNVLASELALPRDPALLARAYLANRIGKLSLGVANGRPFVLMASAGLDAEVVSAMRPALKKIIGSAAYLVEAGRLLLRESPPLQIETDRGIYHAPLAIVANAARYGGDFIVSRDVHALRPGLRLIALRKVDLLSLLRIGCFLIRGKVETSGLIDSVAVRWATIQAAPAAATQIDGDALGRTPLLVHEANEALDILLAQAGAKA
jgi:diacylglycerol kinase family enzyme